MKEFADNNFKFDENGSKLSRRAENTVGKGEIARYEQFLLFTQCFQKACFPGASKGVIVWEWVNNLSFNMNKTRGHEYKIFKKQCRTKYRFKSFSHRIMETWNRLPAEIVSAGSVNSFKSLLNKH